MLKKTFCSVLLLSGVLALAGAPPALVSDSVPDDPPMALPALREPSPQVLALTAFTHFTREKDPAKKLEYLAEMVKHDPRSELALALLYEAPRSMLPPVMPSIYKTACEHPESWMLVNFALLNQKFLPADSPLSGRLSEAALAAMDEPAKLDEKGRVLYRLLLRDRFEQLLQKHDFDAALRLVEERTQQGSLPLEREEAWCFCLSAAEQAPENRRWLGLQSSMRSEFRQKADVLLAGLLQDEASITTEQEVLVRLECYAKAKRPDLVKAFSERNRSRLTVQLRTVDLLREQDPAAALAAALAAEKLARQDDRPLLAQILVYMEMKNYAKAESILPRLRNEEQKFFMQTQIFMYQKKYTELAGVLDTAEVRLLLLPDSKERNARLGHLYFLRLLLAEKIHSQKLLESAENYYRKQGILETPAIANAVGYTLAVLNIRLDEAERLIDIALRAAPNNGAFLDSKGWVLFRKGNLAGAEEYLLKALNSEEIKAGAAATFDHLGDVKAAQKDIPAAREYYKKALAAPLTPDFDPATVQSKLEKLQ